MGCPAHPGGWRFRLFAYFVAEGCRRTHFFHRYLIRLGACALLSQAPFTLATGVWGGSVLLTFFLSAGAIYGYERLSKAEHGPAVSAIPLFAACALALLLNVDYGFPAVLLIFALYLCGDNRRRKLLCLGAGLALLYLLYQPLIGLLSLPLFRPDWMAGYLLHTSLCLLSTHCAPRHPSFCWPGTVGNWVCRASGSFMCSIPRTCWAYGPWGWR